MTEHACTVLTIDDEPLIRESIAAFLEDSGFLVLEAENGAKGLQVLQQNPQVEVILCDLHMPVMSGMEMLAQLRQADNDLPFIIVAGAEMVTEAIDAIRMGASDYVLKPITDMGALERAVRITLERIQLLRENKQYREEIERANQELSERLAEIKEDQQAAKVVQFQLLPERDVHYDKFNFTHNIIPSLYLSGDFVDYFRITETQLGFYIADVSGHGAPSAFVTVLLKSLVNQLLQQYKSNESSTIVQPTVLLKSLSMDIHKAKLGKYLTMVYGVIDLQTDKLAYSVGGHFPNPIMVQPGDCDYLPGNGFPVGVFDKAEYTLHELALPTVFKLVMFSDGVLEILPQQELQQQEAYLLELVRDPAIQSAELLQKLGLPREKALPDDVTFVMVSRGL